jgi:pyruvate, water dikinase
MNKTSYVAGLSFLPRHLGKEVGGKAFGLGELLKCGLAVPAGFIVLTSAFEEFVNGLGIRLFTEQQTREPQDYSSLISISDVVRGRMLAGRIPDPIASQILDSYKDLHRRRVAVRSSATVEDSRKAAWAGQLDTYLNTTEGFLLLNVKKCWASLFKANTLLYSISKGIPLSHVSVAVIVEEMIDSDVSGVTFTTHPEGFDRNLMLIEAGWGLGESIVQGQIIPDRYVVDKRDGVIVDLQISTQTKMLIGDDNGLPHNSPTVLVDVPPSKQRKQKLTGEQISELVNICITVENYFGIPSDIEWAHSNGSFFLLQSRPITTF